MTIIIDNGLLIMAKENDMWNAVIARNVPIFQQLVSPDAVMICGGLKCTGAEYAGFIGDFNLKHFEITEMAITHADENCVGLHYVVTTVAEEQDSDLSGKFYVTSFWTRAEEGWKLMFNMDSRIYDAK